MRAVQFYDGLLAAIYEDPLAAFIEKKEKIGRLAIERYGGFHSRDRAPEACEARFIRTVFGSKRGKSQRTVAFSKERVCLDAGVVEANQHKPVLGLEDALGQGRRAKQEYSGDNRS